MRKAVVGLFAIAFSIRAIIAIIQFKDGISSSLNIDQYLYGSTGFNPGLELYHDFYGYYGKQLSDMAKGLIPYKDFGYSYPPLFLYSLYPIYIIGGLFGASIPIWLSDAATAPLIYLVARRFTNPRLALIAGVAYAVSPFFLLYEGYLWYSSQPMAFFMVLSLYFLVTERPLFSSIIFAIAVLFKQELIFIFPIFLLWTYKRYPRSALLKMMASMVIIIALVSLPFILITPQGYVSAMSYGTMAPSIFVNSSNATSSLFGPISNSNLAPQTLVCNTISDTWRSLICNYGNFTYTDAKLVAPWTTVFNAAFMNYISIWIFIPLLAAICYNIVRLRRDPSAVLLLGSTILACILGAFSYEIHMIYRYYLIPVYVLPMVTSRNRLSMSCAIAIPLFSLLLPSGLVQLPLAMSSILTVLLFNQRTVTSTDQVSILSTINNH